MGFGLTGVSPQDSVRTRRWAGEVTSEFPCFGKHSGSHQSPESHHTSFPNKPGSFLPIQVNMDAPCKRNEEREQRFSLPCTLSKGQTRENVFKHTQVFFICEKENLSHWCV